MKSIYKKIISAFIVVAVAMTTILIPPTIDAEAASKMTYNDTETIYLNCKGSKLAYGQGTIKIKNPTGSITKVKSSNNKVVFVSFNTSKRIDLIGKKPGKATITFTMKSKKYKCKVTVKKYTNPVKSLKVSGVSSGKNISSKFKKTNEVDASLKNTKKNAKLVVKPSSGWKLKSVEIAKGSNNPKTKNYNTAKQKTIKLGTLKKGKYYSFILTFKNKKTGGKNDVIIYLNE